MKRIMMLGLVVAALVMTTGCLTDGLYGKQVSTVPGAAVRTNTVFVTNTIVTPAVTNYVQLPGTTNFVEQVKPVEVRSVVQPLITIDYAPAMTVTNLVENPGVKGAVQMVGSLPIPFAAPIALGLGWLYSAIAAFRNKKAATALVTGIEAGRAMLQTPELRGIDQKFKDVLVNHQEVGGVLNLVSKIVNEHTGDTVKPGS